jgi:hypothetical protein
MERLTDVDVLLCAGLEEGGLVCICQLLALERVNLSAEKMSGVAICGRARTELTFVKDHIWSRQ